MPELPEVETIKRQLAQNLIGKRIEKIWIKRNSRIFRKLSHPRKIYKLKGKKIVKIKRRAKYLIFIFNNKQALVFHLGMTGGFKFEKKNKKPALHFHLEMCFSDCKLSFSDLRKFGKILLTNNSELNKIKELSGLGPEPFSDEFNKSWLAEKFCGRKAPVKSLLLDQHICAGVGNIYADEACYRAGILPTRPAGSLGKEEISRLVRSIKKVLKDAIDFRGTTIRDYQTAFSKSGGYQPKVYGREGEPCLKCGEKIRRTKISGRSSYFCPSCQR